MKVKRTLHQIYSELTELRKTRETTCQLVARSVIENNKHAIEHFSDEYKHFDEVINYLSHIEVEYEDKYETEEDED